jgi:hypothetical protein
VSPGTPGVFSRQGRSGKRFEIFYRDGEGVQHWEVLPVGSTLTDADKLRRGRMARVDRGEKIAPARLTFQDVAKQWQAKVAESELRPRTRELYEQSLRTHVLPKPSGFRD